MKKSRTYSRRQQALFAVALLAAAVALSQMLGLIALLPGQVVRENELSNGLPAMEIFYSADGGEAPMRGKRLYLSRSGDTLLYSVAQFTPLGGWYPMFNGTVLDLREGGCAAYHCVSRGETGWLCLFGFVPEGEDPYGDRAGGGGLLQRDLHPRSGDPNGGRRLLPVDGHLPPAGGGAGKAGACGAGGRRIFALYLHCSAALNGQQIWIPANIPGGAPFGDVLLPRASAGHIAASAADKRFAAGKTLKWAGFARPFESNPGSPQKREAFVGGVSRPGREFLCPRRQRNQNAAQEPMVLRYLLLPALLRPPITGAWLSKG